MTTMDFRKRMLSAGSALRVLALVGAGAAAGFASAPAVAQDYTNVTASGRVVSTDGTEVPGATVTYVSNGQGFTRTTTTDSSGGFRIPQLPAGNYTVTITADGFDTLTDAALPVTPDNPANQFAIAPVGGSGDIVVTAGRTQIIDFERTTTGIVVNVAELASRVPVARDLTSIIRLSPGTSAGDTAFGNLASVGGSSVSENAFFVNGLNITDFRKGLGSATVPFDFYETVEVKNGGYQAEFGRATGGVINATTKSGTNEFHASMLINWQPDFLRSDAPDTRTPAGTLLVDNSRDREERREVTIQASGPIIKDRLFFYGLYNYRYIDTGNSVATANRYDNLNTDSPFWGGKIDFVPFDGHRIEGTYFNSKGVQFTNSFTYNPETDELGAFNSGEELQYGSENYVARYTGTLSEFLTVSAAYGKSKLRDSTLPLDTDRPYVIDNRTSPPSVIGNPSQIIELAEDEREFYRFDADVYFDLLGSHHIRVGYDNEKLLSDNQAIYTGDVAYQYYLAGPGDNFAPEGTNYAAGRTFISGGLFDSRNEAFYIQDNWSLFDNRLQLQLGLRNDRFENFNADGDSFYASGNQWAPRLGFTFDVLGDQRAKIYGSFGRYYLPVPSNTNIRLAGAEYDLTRYNVLNGVNADGSPILGAPLTGFTGADNCYDTGINQCENVSDGTANPTEALVSKNLKPQSTDEYILGAEVRLAGRWKLGLFGTYRKLNESLEDVAIDAAVLNYCETNGLDCNTADGSPIWSGFHQYVLLNPGADSTITLSDPINGESSLRTIDFTAAELGYPQAERTYKAVTFTFEREFDGVWSLQGSYTYSKNKGNIEGGVKSDNGQDDSGITTDFDQPGFTVGSNGFLPNHRAHNFKAFGSYQVTDWLMLGANVEVQSPRKFGCIGRVPNSVDAFAGAYGAAGFFCNVVNGEVVTNPNTPGFSFSNPASGTSSLVSTPRGSIFESDWRKEVGLTAVFKLPTDRYDASLRFDVFNVLNSKSQVDFEERGTLANGQPRSDYRLPTGYQTPRYVRMQLSLGF